MYFCMHNTYYVLCIHKNSEKRDNTPTICSDTVGTIHHRQMSILIVSEIDKISGLPTFIKVITI